MENQYIFEILHPINLYNHESTSNANDNKKMEDKSIVNLTLNMQTPNN